MLPDPSGRAGAFGLVYGWAFERLVHRGGAHIGAGFGLARSLASGLIVGLMPRLHPLMFEDLAPPGPFLADFGAWTVVAFFALHVLYAALVGALYGPARPTQAQAKPVAKA